VAASTALLADTLAWPTSLELYLPRAWAQDAERRERAGIPRSVRFHEKWRLALTHLVRVARGRWPIEQQHRELKDGLGLDHFEGRSYRGWNHHAVLAALTYTFLQRARRRGTTRLPTFPDVRNWIREIVAVLFLLERQKWLNLWVSFLRDPPLRI
jgi:SRSO17 transposase